MSGSEIGKTGCVDESFKKLVVKGKPGIWWQLEDDIRLKVKLYLGFFSSLFLTHISL